MRVSKRKLAYHYDGLGRIAKRGFHANGEANVETEAPLFQSEYTYASGGYGANSTTARVQSIAQAGQKREYWYDKAGEHHAGMLDGQGHGRWSPQL